MSLLQEDKRPKKVIKLDTFKPRPYQMPFIEAFEKQQYKRYVLCWGRRCLSGNTHIIMTDGSWKFLKDIEIGDKILSWDGQKFVEDVVKNKWSTGIKQTKKIQSHGFLPLISSEDHVFAVYNTYSKRVTWERALRFKRGKQALNYAGIEPGTLSNPELAEFIGYMTWKHDVPKSKKRLLSYVWRFDKPSLLRFFCAVISADGSIYLHQEKKLADKIIHATGEITLNCGLSYELCWDMYWLLRKIGLKPAVPVNEKGSNWKIRISHTPSVRTLLDSYPIYGKTEKQKLVMDAIRDYTADTSIYKNCFLKRANIVDDQDQELFDIETEKNHNFIANGYVVHNSGKDVCAFNLIYRAAMRKTAVYFYILPTYKQARKVIWDSINNDSVRFLDYINKEAIYKTNSQEMKITLINGSIIQLIGSDSIDSIVGTNPAGAVFSEYAMQSDLAYQYLRPIFLGNQGWMVFISTPRGHNGFYDLFETAKHNSDNWFSSMLTIEDTKHIDVKEIEADIEEGLMSYELARQEYWCDFSLGAEGAFYAKHIKKMVLDNRITDVLYDPSLPVHTAWDLGINDPTVIIFFQVSTGGSIRIIDYYEKKCDSLEAHIKYVKEKPYTYGFHIGPHDIRQREQSSNITRWEKAHGLGITFKVAPGVAEKVYVYDGIEAVRTIFSRLYIDEVRCKDLIRHIENYSQEYDYKNKVYKTSPKHDLHSHAADCLRYLATSLHLLSVGMTQEDIDRAKLKARNARNSNIPRAFH